MVFAYELIKIRFNFLVLLKIIYNFNTKYSIFYYQHVTSNNLISYKLNYNLYKFILNIINIL